MGRVPSSQGIRSDDSKDETIANMEPPQDKTALQKILGMIRFLAHYIPGEASLAAPLTQLLQESISWQWLWEHDKALQQLETALHNAPVLRF